MVDRAESVQEAFESRQDSTEQALENLLAAIRKHEERKKEQATKGLDGLTYFFLSKFTNEGIPSPEKVATKVWEAFERHLNWKTSEAEMREARKQETFVIFSEEDDLDKVITTVDALLHPPAKALHVMKRWHNRDEFKARVLEWAASLR